MISKKISWKVPFDLQGNMQDYETNCYTGSWKENNLVAHPPEMRDPVNFVATLTFREILRGRSAATFWFSDEKGHKYPMFMGDGVAAIPHMVNGVLKAQFEFRKQGANYGIRRVSDG